MSREPSSFAHQFLHGQARSPRPEPLSVTYEQPPEKPDGKPIRTGKRRFRVLVPPKKRPGRDPNALRWTDMTPAERASFTIHPKEKP